MNATPREGEVRSRVFTLSELETRAEEERVVEATLSSEEPVDRGYALEVLSHARSAVDLGRAKRGLALLWQHDARDVLGRVEAIAVRGRKLRGRLRFGASQRAREMWEDVKAGVLQELSIGYRIHEVEESRDADNRVTHTAVSWTPLEVSLVSIPADVSVGIGRSETMEPNTQDRAPAGVRGDADAARRERERIAEIQAVASRWPRAADQAQRAIDEGWSVKRFKSWALDHAIGRAEPLDLAEPGEQPTRLGLGRRELERYSIVRAARAFATKDWREAGLELEASRAIEQRLGRQARGFLVPLEVIQAPMQRAVEKGGTASGAGLVPVDLLAGSFVDLLRNRLMVRALGATVLNGLVGDVDVPRQTVSVAGEWLAEGGTVTGGDSVYDTVRLSPKTVAAKTPITRRMVLQSTPAIEQLVRSDLAAVLALAVDLAAIQGGGANEPEGILETAGVGSVVAGNPDGGAPTWAHVVALESAVANANADQGTLAYLTNSKVRGKLKTTEKAVATGMFVWEDGPGMAPGFGMLNGYRAAVSNQVPDDGTKGGGTNLSAIIFGNWADLLIGEWGVLDLTADAITLADSGGLVIRAFMDVDVAVRHPESFAALTDAVTT